MSKSFRFDPYEDDDNRGDFRKTKRNATKKVKEAKRRPDRREFDDRADDTGRQRN